mmetsp:Transcript_37994/g.122197  ORF Transcript_37994/g.122197 Transcript_37994/m.122197 type:complete len:202 (+) Transcript_37994:734-1339(+)
MDSLAAGGGLGRGAALVYPHAPHAVGHSARAKGVREALKVGLLRLVEVRCGCGGVAGPLVGEGLVKVVGVLERSRLRLEGRLDGFGEQVVPVLPAEEGVLQHLVALALATKALRRLSHQHALNDVLAFWAHPCEFGLGVDDFSVDVFDGVAPEGREASHHLIQHAAERPVVHLDSVDLAHPDLGREVHRRAAKSVCRLAFL